MHLNKFLSKKNMTASQLAREIGCSSTDISNWKAGNRQIPILSAVAIEKATNGEVSRKDCRPDDWHMIWPELIQESEACHG